MIPFLSNVGFTTVSSSGTLNDKAGTSKSKLPVQVFRLTDNISGNLTMSNDSAHKKIILDTNGNNITNSSGSPITNNSSKALEIIGSGNVQSTLKTFTATQASDSYTGTTLSTSQTQPVFGTPASPNITSATLSVNADTATTSSYSSPVTISGTSTLSLGSFFVNNRGNDYAYTGWGFTGTSFVTFNFTRGAPDSDSHGQPTTGPQNYAFGNGDASYNLGLTNIVASGVTVITTGRRVRFTNNLAIAVAITGDDNPFGSVSVSAGATQTANRDSTDGSFAIVGTISGNDGSSQPYALVPVNNGTGSIVTSGLTGTLSASAL